MSDEKKRRQYGSGSIFQRKDGMWVGRLDVGFDRTGRRRRVQVSATTEPRCKEKLEEKKLEIARHGVPDLAASRLTVSKWAERWLADIVNDLRPSSYRTTESAVRVWITPIIGRRKLSQLGPADFRSIYTAQREDGKGQGTLVRTHAVLTKMLKDAAREGLPIPQAALLAKKPQIGETDRQAIPLDQCLSILKVVADRPDASLWAAALLQGHRQGERLGLTWSCIDFDSETIDISWQLQTLPYIDNRNKHLGFRVPDGYVAQRLTKAWHLVRPKSKRSRRITPMVPWMRDALLSWREVAPTNDYDLVWPADDGMPIRVDDDREEWKAIQAEAGVTHPAGRPYVLHEARHSTATLLLELGVPRDIVEAILGHSQLVEAYDHANRLPAQRKALAALAKRLELGN